METKGRTNVHGRMEGLKISLSIKERKGFELSKKFRSVLLEKGEKVSSKQFGGSTIMFFFDGFSVKISSYKYGNGVTLIEIKEKTELLSKILGIFVELVADYYEEDGKNEMLIYTTGKYSPAKGKTLIKQINKDLEERYVLSEEGNIFSIITRNTYWAKVNDKAKKLTFDEQLKTAVSLKKGMLCFLPHAVTCILGNVEKNKEIFHSQLEKNIEI